MRLAGLALLMAVHASAADEVRLSNAERQADVEWLTSLGLKVPEGGPLLERPFAEPFTFRSLLVPIAWWRSPSPREVPADRLRQDLPLLRVIMEKAYGGWASAEKRGWNWSAWFADWDRELAAKGDASLPLALALAPMGKLMDFQLDNHTGPVGVPVRFGSVSRTAVLEAAAEGACTAMKTPDDKTFALDPQDPAQRLKKASIVAGSDGAVEAGTYFVYPGRRGQAAAIQCGGKWTPVHTTWLDDRRAKLIADLAAAPGEAPSYRTISPAMGYLRLPSFTKQNGELLRKLLTTLPATAGHEKLVIIDLRGNDGGDGPVEAIARWVDAASVRRAFNFNRSQPISCVYTALGWGYTQVTTQSLKPPISDALRRNLQRNLDALFEPAPAGCPVKVEEEGVAWSYRQHTPVGDPPAGKPRLLVLVDNGCGSDCEYMTHVLAAEPGAVIAGENTLGVGQFIQPGYFILPQSRVKFRIARGMSDDYGDGRSFDGYGLDVDIVLASEGSQSAAGILRLAERLSAGGEKEKGSK